MAKRVGMSRHKKTFGKNNSLFGFHPIFIPSLPYPPSIYHPRHIYSQQFSGPETINPPEEDCQDERRRGLPKRQSLHLYCAFLFIRPNIPFSYTHCHTFDFTFSPSLQHVVHVRKHNHTQFTYCFIHLCSTYCFTTHSVYISTPIYYTKWESVLQ